MPEQPAVKGYVPFNEAKAALVNSNKVLEEQVLRRIEELQAIPMTDKRMLAKGFTEIQDAFMWINRAIFQPTRIEGEL